MSAFVRRNTLLALGLFLLVSSVQAQVTTATLYGTVLDSSGAIVAGASVTLTNEGTGASTAKTSGPDGSFAFDFVRVGSYRLSIEAPGFKSLVTNAIDLQAGTNLRRTFSLEVGAVNETVSVQAAAALVNSVSAEQSHEVSTREAAELPLSKRNISNLLGLATGASAGGGFVRLNGVGRTGTLYTVDGTSATADPESRTTSMRGNFEQINLVSLEAVQELQTTKGILPAEYGQVLGGNVNIITKSGTNNWHGSAFENFQAENLNARLQFLTTKPNSVFNQFGGALSGPIIHDRVFVFGDYEGYRQSVTTVISGNVPTPQFRQTLLTAVPDYAKALSVIPDPNQSFAAGADTALFIGGAPQVSTDNHFDLKGDIHITSTSNLAMTYAHGRPYQFVPRIFLGHANDRQFHGFSDRGTASYVTGAATWTSETRFGYSLSDMDRTDLYILQGIPETLPFGGRLPGFTYPGFSTPSSEIWLEEGRTWSLEEKFVRFMGKHTVKAGGIFMKNGVFRNNPQNPIASYSTRASLLANIPDSINLTFGNGSYSGSNYVVGAFIQDNWRAAPRLSVNLGVRYDYYSKYVATPAKGLDFALYNFNGLLDNQFHFGPVRNINDPIDSDGWVNLAPRIGFSYDVTGKSTTTIRGGFGVMYSPLALGVFSGAVASKYIPFRAILSRQDGIDNNLRFPLYNDTVAPIFLQRQITSPSVVFDPHLQTPYVMASYLGLQHALTSTLVLETAYVGNRGVKFPLNRTYNQPDRVTGIRPNTALLQGYYLDNSQLSDYHSWQSSLSMRFSHNLTFAVRYTWGKQLANDSGDIGAYYQNDGNVRAQDFFNLRREWGPADGDTRHSFSSDWVYALPTLKSMHSAILRQAFGGWQTSGIVSAATGNPLLITEGNGENTSRPDYIGGPTVNPDYQKTLQYLNKAAFGLVPISTASGLPVRPGNLGHGAVFGPGLWNVDLSLGKNFKILEKAQLQVRMDVFNAFNHTSLSGFSLDSSSGSFGRFTNTRGARVSQLNARISF
jgi:outer membrane receptor protein involved in Fe transport